MSLKDLHYVFSITENEGFEYTFTGYSDFKNVKDKKFHTLRKAYLKAGAELAEYIGDEESEKNYRRGLK